MSEVLLTLITLRPYIFHLTNIANVWSGCEFQEITSRTIYSTFANIFGVYMTLI